MGIQDLTEEVLLVTLREEPGADSEVQCVTRMIVDDGPRHVIVDFSFVQKIASTAITDLIILESELQEAQRQLILCCVPPKIRRVLAHANLETFFRFSDSEFAALQMLAASECYYG